MKRALFILAITAASLIVGSAAASAATPTVKTGSSALGRVLVDARGRTLYLFEKDPRARSDCAGTCAVYWPPFLTRGTPVAGPGTKSSLLGTIRRANGTRQVTYAGHPLYLFVQDTRPGQVTGEGSRDFGAGWDALTPGGRKIEKDAS